MKKTITIGPFSLQFTNVNTEMKIPGHSHFATLELTFETEGRIGFPAFESTYQAIAEKIKELTAKPLRDHKNEDVADMFFEAFADANFYNGEPFHSWGGKYALDSIRLGVRGVPDKIGHADGFTFYSVSR